MHLNYSLPEEKPGERSHRMPRKSNGDVRKKMLKRISGFEILRFNEDDDAVISVSLQKAKA